MSYYRSTTEKVRVILKLYYHNRSLHLQRRNSKHITELRVEAKSEILQAYFKKPGKEYEIWREVEKGIWVLMEAENCRKPKSKEQPRRKEESTVWPLLTQGRKGSSLEALCLGLGEANRLRVLVLVFVNCNLYKKKNLFGFFFQRERGFGPG